MKKIFLIYKLLLPLTFISLYHPIYAQQSNFQIAPSPIAYPYFREGAYDGSLGLSFINISTENVTLTGGSGDFTGRLAFTDFAAADGDFGISMMGGSMPGIVPTVPLNPYIPVPAGDSSLMFISFRMAFNLELQPVKSDMLNMILFGGINMNLSQLTVTTPFNLLLPPGYTSVAKGYTDTLTISTTLSGWQAGIQLDIPLGGDTRLSPFLMYSSFSGTATLTDSTTVSGYGSVTMTADVTAASSTSFGMDIHFGEYSIGTLMQQMSVSDNTTQDTNIIVISVSYHISGNSGSTPDGE